VAISSSIKQSIDFNLLRRFRQHADAVLLFISDRVAPFTNNLGERAVRMSKVKQKVSSCFRAVVGAENFCVIRSCLDTLRKQGHGMLEVLRLAFTGDPIQLAA
jgi:transposase